MRVPPPSAASATTWPPCDSATCRTIARPSPEPGQPARRARAVEAVEDVREVLLVDPGAVVAHHDLPVFDGDLDLAVGRAPLGGVVEEVRDRPLDARRNAVDERLLEVGV